MNQYKITADVYGHQFDQVPRYRIYVDQDLITERDFIWPGHEVFVRENIVVNLAPGNHKIRIEQIGTNCKVLMKNITIDGVPSKPDFITN
jgi:hypothetical protein